MTCWYLFGQRLLQCGQSRVGVAGVGLKALDSFPQTSQLFVLILQLLQQILDLQRERRDRELSEASTVRVKTRSVTTREGKRSGPGSIPHSGPQCLRLTSQQLLCSAAFYSINTELEKHTKTQAWTQNTPGCSKQNTSRCCWSWTQSNETQEVYKLVTKGQHIW